MSLRAFKSVAKAFNSDEDDWLQERGGWPR
jgi:hypothetical protein